MASEPMVPRLQEVIQVFDHTDQKTSREDTKDVGEDSAQS